VDQGVSLQRSEEECARVGPLEDETRPQSYTQRPQQEKKRHTLVVVFIPGTFVNRWASGLNSGVRANCRKRLASR